METPYLCRGMGTNTVASKSKKQCHLIRASCNKVHFNLFRSRTRATCCMTFVVLSRWNRIVGFISISRELQSARTQDKCLNSWVFVFQDPPSAKVAPHRPQCGVPPKSVIAPKTHAWQMPPVKLKTQNEYVPHGQPTPQKQKTTRYHILGHKNRYIATESIKRQRGHVLCI